MKCLQVLLALVAIMVCLARADGHRVAEQETLTPEQFSEAALVQMQEAMYAETANVGWPCCRICPQQHLIDIDQMLGSTPPARPDISDLRPGNSEGQMAEQGSESDEQFATGSCCNVCPTGTWGVDPPADENPEGYKTTTTAMKFSKLRPPLPPCCPFCFERHAAESYTKTVGVPPKTRDLPRSLIAKNATKVPAKPSKKKKPVKVVKPAPKPKPVPQTQSTPDKKSKRKGLSLAFSFKLNLDQNNNLGKISIGGGNMGGGNVVATQKKTKKVEKVKTNEKKPNIAAIAKKSAASTVVVKPAAPIVPAGKTPAAVVQALKAKAAIAKSSFLEIAASAPVRYKYGINPTPANCCNRCMRKPASKEDDE